MKYKIILLVAILATIARANILVIAIEEKKLPYELSPKNYDLSSANYDNSVSNYDNSPSNYDNSSSNYDNSPSNYDNTVNGDRSILVEEEKKLIHYGYYITNKEGLTNFYSPKGKRLFYSPKGSMGLYHGTKGFFCGAIAKVQGKIRLALTEQGQRVLLLGEWYEPGR